MARCRRYLNRKLVTRQIPDERIRYPQNRLYSHRRPITSIEHDRSVEDRVADRGLTTDENEL